MFYRIGQIRKASYIKVFSIWGFLDFCEVAPYLHLMAI